MIPAFRRDLAACLRAIVRAHVLALPALALPALALPALALPVLAVSGFLAFAGPALSQDFGGAFSGMRDQDSPIEIEADRLEVKDDKGLAVFEGNVSVAQGTTLLRTRRLTVHYASGGQGAIGGNGNIRLIEATGRVAVRSGDQAATADKAVVDMTKQVATLSGNVSISQGDNVVTGCVLTVDLKTNNADFQPCSGADSGRVKMRLTPRSGGAQ